MPLRFTFQNDEPRYLLNAKNADPQVIGERLWQITEDHDGRLLPDDVVDDAKDRHSPLHPHFQWDDRAAAHAYRIDQAREMIRIIVRADDDDEDEQPRRAFINLSDADGRSYRTVDEVLGSADLQRAVMAQALKDLQSWEARYNELSDICHLVKAASSRLSAQLQQRSKPQQPPPRRGRPRRSVPVPPATVARGRRRPTTRPEASP